MNKEQRDFKGVWIPKVVWLDKRLNALDKIILIEIDSLDNNEDGCFASNQYLADFCQCSVSKISSSISNLIKYNYLYIKRFDGRTRYLKSRLSKNENQPSKNCKAELQNLEDININNNTNNNIDINNNKFKKPTLEEVKNYCNERNNNIDAQHFIDYYESNGWKVGRNSMKDWKATIRTWERNNFNNQKQVSKKNNNIFSEIAEEEGLF